MDTLQQLRAGTLRGTRYLKLSEGLRQFPHEILELADTLEVLDLSGNALTELPDDLPRLRHLRVLFCSNNPFRQLPPVLGQCAQLSMIGFKACAIESVPATSLPANLRWLILTDNRIESLPDEIGQCRQLQKLMLAGNRLQALPESLADCHNLELLRIAANHLPQLPDWLARMPRLAWLAYAGNPFSAAQEQYAAQLPIPAIIWSALLLGEKLGEGASGQIFRAQLQDGDARRPLALKLFKGEVTSDGLAATEMAACMAAGVHPQLITVLGRLTGHPQQVPGLLLALIDPAFRVLARPPSLESCTRDCYPSGLQFSLRHVLLMLQGVASVVCHLHQRQIMHGDLYAHNIHFQPDGQVLLGDFGAASLLAGPAEPLQRLEVRAFGLLMQELLQRCQHQSNQAAVHASLAGLQQRCCNEIVAQRPLFAEIQALLAQCSAAMA